MSGGRFRRSIPIRLGFFLLLIVPALGSVRSQSLEGGNPQRFLHLHRARLAEYGRVPLAFEPNVGQVRGAGSERVRFVARRPGFMLFLLADEMVLKPRIRDSGFGIQESSDQSSVVRSQLSHAKGLRLSGPEPRIPPAPGLRRAGPNPESRAPTVVRLKWAGANRNPKIASLEGLPGKTNYFAGHDPAKWREGVPTYGRVRAANIYPGIDAVYFGHEGQLEYDLVVHPGANPEAIKLELENGKSKVEIDANGDLLIATPAGEVHLRKPIAYQRDATGGRRSYVRCEWVFATGSGPRTAGQSNSPFTIDYSQLSNPENPTPNPGIYVSFDLGTYDPSNDLIIDPVLSYSTYLGGSGYDSASAIAVDSEGNAYITGQTDSLDFPSASAAQKSIGGGTCGTTLDVFPCFDAFVTKLSADGSSIVYSTYFGGSGDDRGTGIAVDSAGSAYITGITNSADLPVANALQRKYAGGNCGSSTNPIPCFDAFVAKLNSSGSSIVYSTYLGGTGQDLAAGIALDSAGEATVAGSTSSQDFPVGAAAPQATFAGGTLDVFVTRLDSTGAKVLFSTDLGGSGEDRGLGVAVDAAGDTFIAGRTTSGDFPSVNGFQNSNAGGLCGSSTSPTPCTDAFVTKLNASGTEIAYSTYLGGTGGDIANAIAVDADGAAFVAGSTTSSDFPTTPGSFQQSGGGTSTDAFVSKIAPDGSALEYSTYLGGIGQEAAYGIAVDSSGIAFVTGYANDAAFPVASPVQKAGGGFNDVSVSKVSADGSALIFSSYLGGSGDESGEGIAVDTAGDAYIAGWTFSTDFPVVSAFDTSYAGGSYDGFVAKLSGLKLPVAKLSETNVVFAGQGVGTSSALENVTFTNRGDGPLTISGVTVSGEFTESNDCPSTLEPQATCTLFISSSPEDLGPQTGAVTIADNAWGSPHLISLAGSGLPSPVAAFSPGNLSFPPQLVGTTSPAQSVMLTNPGSVTLDISGVTVLGDFSQSNNCGSFVVAGGHCNFQVTFTPKSAGTQSGQISITDDAPGSPHAILLSGTGTGPAVSFSPVSLSFGSQDVGTTSAPQTVILTSTGVMALTISSIFANGDFAEVNNCPSALAPGATCKINVTFTPGGGGLRSGSVVVTDNAAASPQTVSLSGVAADAVAALSRTSVIFPDQGVSTTSAPQTVMLSNSGGDLLRIWGIATSGDFSETNDCGLQLVPGASCDIQLVFAPTVTGTRTGVLSISDNAVGSPQRVSLTGTGVTAFSLAAAPNLATVVVGTNTASFTLSAASPYAYGQTIALACDSGAEIHCAFDPASIKPGDASTLTVGDLPSAAPSSFSFHVSGTSGSQSVTVPLTVRIADYSISTTTSTAAVSAGQSATLTLNVQAINGFDQPISIECSGAPPLATCQAFPATVTPNEADSTRVAITIATTAPAVTTPNGDGHRKPPLLPTVWRMWAALAMALGFVLFDKRKLLSLRKRLAMGSVELLAAMLLAGCGGGGQAPVVHHPGTPAGRYDLKISATSGQLVHTLPFTLQVN